MKVIMMVLGLLAAVTATVSYAGKADECVDAGGVWHYYSGQCITDFNALVSNEISDGHVHITMPGEIEEDAVLGKKIKTPDGRIFMQGEYKIDLGGNESTTGELAITVNNVTQIGDTRGTAKYFNYLIPFAVNSRGSGTFWYLGLFNADFKAHRVVLSDSLYLGDRVDSIVVHTTKDGNWVKYKDHDYGQSMADKPNLPVSKFLTFDESLRYFTVPVSANLWSLDKQKFDAYKYPYNKKYPFLPDFWEEQFYALGYSEDGSRFAYIRDNIGNEAGVKHIEVFVQDLVTDKILWKHELLTDEGNPENIYFNEFWKRDNQLIMDALKTYGILWSNQLNAKDGDIRHKSDRLRYYAVNKKAPRLYGYDPTVVQTGIYLESRERGKKRIHKKIYKEQSYLLDIQPIGYFPPAEGSRRVAIIVGYLYTGYEGPPNEIRYGIIGAHLETGFKK